MQQKSLFTAFYRLTQRCFSATLRVKKQSVTQALTFRKTADATPSGKVEAGELHCRRLKTARQGRFFFETKKAPQGRFFFETQTPERAITPA
ncbi:MAG: hypothetical protein AAGC71_12130, partial [Pseudomonadota bacterium]